MGMGGEVGREGREREFQGRVRKGKNRGRRWRGRWSTESKHTNNRSRDGASWLGAGAGASYLNPWCPFLGPKHMLYFYSFFPTHSSSSLIVEVEILVVFFLVVRSA